MNESVKVLNPENEMQYSEISTSTQQHALLDLYRPQSSVYFSSSSRALLAQPPFASLMVQGFSGLEQQVKESLRFAGELGFENAMVVGAVPFDITEKAHLRVSTNFITENKVSNSSQKILGSENSVDTSKLIRAKQCVSVPSPQTYIANVKDALQRFARGELDKVVLSRTLEVECESRPNVRDIVKNLSAKNTHGYTFAVNLKDNADRSNNSFDLGEDVHTLIGASPELLISRKGKKIVAQPLAGSEPRCDDPLIDNQRAKQLLNSKKDRYEHALVIKAIQEALTPFCSELKVPETPSLVSTATMWHLATKIEGELKTEDTSSLTLALAMHPTPAVGGYPYDAARKAISELEEHERGLFTGMVGWCDASGDGEWVVTIRCAEIKENKIRLFAGAGIVDGSDPEKELAETAAKFNTMLNALGISAA